MSLKLDVASSLPVDGTAGTLVGRVWRPELDGPSIVVVRGTGVFDVSHAFATMRDLCEADDPAAAVAAAEYEFVDHLAEVLRNTPEAARDPGKPWLLAPID